MKSGQILSGVFRRFRADALLHQGLTEKQLLERFIADRDEAAFDALIRQHGSMVWGVARRLLRNDADAEDAFQVTFLILVQKAATVADRGSLGNWLYGVARNTALKARAMKNKRRTN